MKFTQKQIVIVIGALLVVVVFGLLVFLGTRSSSQTQKITLTIWGTDPKKVFDDMGAAYKAYDPGVTINYTQIDPSEYQSDLLNGFAGGTGPDIFEISNRELPKWQFVLAPVPSQSVTQFNATTLQNDFPTTVSQDFLSGGEIYALPLDMDTLAMLYNEDIFDSAGIVFPPATWDDFQTDITSLRKINSQGQITQAAAAIGGSSASIENSADILYLLMLQNGTVMTNGDSSYQSASFASSDSSGKLAGLAAFNFYLQFANANSPYYTWNDGLGDASQNFIQGKVAIIFGYASDLAQIKGKSPFLDVGVAPVPQPANATISVNYPKYLGLAVSKRGQVSAAWQFILYMTTNSGEAQIYSKDTGEPPALRALIAENLDSANPSVFDKQALSARSWYEVDDVQIDSIMNSAIQSVLNGTNDSTRALSVAQNAVTTLMSNH